MFHFTPITAALLAAVLQASTAGPGATIAADAEHLTRALAEWELYAATSGADAEVAAALEVLATEARAAAAAAPKDAAIAREAEAVETARARFRAERGLERPAAQQSGQEPRDPRPSDEEVIAMAILNHLHAEPTKEHQDAILRFGSRAVPALVSSARSMSAANALGAPAIALDTLALIDVQKALEVSWELSAQPSFLVRRAIADVLARRDLYSKEALWTPMTDGDHLPAVPEWGLLVERLLSEPAVAATHLRSVLVACVARGFAPQAVIDAVMTLDQPDQWPNPGFVPPASRALYLAGAHHPNAAVRKFCASYLAGFPDATPVFALHVDTDADVRRGVAAALGQRTVRGHVGLGSYSNTTVKPDQGPAYLAALEACLTDPDKNVRSAAVNALQQAFRPDEAPPLAPAELARLGVRTTHVDVKLPLAQLMSQYATAYVADAAEGLLSDVGLRANDNNYATLFDALMWATARDDGSATASAVLRALEVHATPHEWGVALGRDTSEPWTLLRKLSDERRVHLVRLLAARWPSAAWKVSWWWHKVEHDAAPWRALMLDAEATTLERAIALEWSLGPDAPTDDHLAAIVATASASAREFTAVESPSTPGSHAMTPLVSARWLSGVSSALVQRGVPQRRFLGALFGDRSVPDAVLLKVRLDTRRGLIEDQAELARAILARYPLETWDALVDHATPTDVLGLAHTLTPAERVPLIEGALNLQDESRWQPAIEAAGRCRDSALIEVLRRFCLTKGSTYLVSVANTAASFLSDDAAKLILELAARTSYSEARATILAALQQVIDYQTALAQWQQRNDATAVRMRAIAELVAVIDDTSVPEAQRAEALRGLGLLGAVEELPRLVRTLSAPSEALRTAAREALDRLNAAPVK
jgi:HEAT repeat protein